MNAEKILSNLMMLFYWIKETAKTEVPQIAKEFLYAYGIDNGVEVIKLLGMLIFLFVVAYMLYKNFVKINVPKIPESIENKDCYCKGKGCPTCTEELNKYANKVTTLYLWKGIAIVGMVVVFYISGGLINKLQTPIVNLIKVKYTPRVIMIELIKDAAHKSSTGSSN